MDDKQNLPHVSDRMPRWLFCLLVVMFYLAMYPFYLAGHWGRNELWKLRLLLQSSAAWWRLVVFEYSTPARQFVSAVILWAMVSFSHGPHVPSVIPGEGSDVQELD